VVVLVWLQRGRRIPACRMVLTMATGSMRGCPLPLSSIAGHEPSHVHHSSPTSQWKMRGVPRLPSGAGTAFIATRFRFFEPRDAYSKLRLGLQRISVSIACIGWMARRSPQRETPLRPVLHLALVVDLECVVALFPACLPSSPKPRSSRFFKGARPLRWLPRAGGKKAMNALQFSLGGYAIIEHGNHQSTPLRCRSFIDG
jgi:hypothetical protein